MSTSPKIPLEVFFIFQRYRYGGFNAPYRAPNSASYHSHLWHRLFQETPSIDHRIKFLSAFEGHPRVSVALVYHRHHTYSPLRYAICTGTSRNFSGASFLSLHNFFRGRSGFPVLPAFGHPLFSCELLNNREPLKFRPAGTGKFWHNYYSYI